MLKKDIEKYILSMYEGISETWQVENRASLLTQLVLLEGILDTCFNYTIASGCHETCIYKGAKKIFSYEF